MTTDAIDRSVPQELVDLAVLAIKRGAQRVALGLEGLDHDFHAPIGWILWITEADENGFPKEAGATMISHQIGSTFDNLVLPAAFADESVSVPVVDALVELFQAAVKNGWDAGYERRIMEQKSRQQVAEKHGGPNPVPMRHELRCTASNWAYDEQARERGDQVSTNALLSLYLREAGSTEPTEPIGFTDAGGSHHRTTQDEIETLLNRRAPHFAPVAYFDDDLEQWVL